MPYWTAQLESFQSHHWFGGQSMASEAGVRLAVDYIYKINEPALPPLCYVVSMVTSFRH